MAIMSVTSMNVKGSYSALNNQPSATESGNTKVMQMRVPVGKRIGFGGEMPMVQKAGTSVLKKAMFMAATVLAAGGAAIGLGGCSGGASPVSAEDGNTELIERSSSSTDIKDTVVVNSSSSKSDTTATASSGSSKSDTTATASSSSSNSDTTATDTIDYAKYVAMGPGTYILENGDTLLVLSDTAKATVDAMNTMLTYVGAGPETANATAKAMKKPSAVASTKFVTLTGSNVPIPKRMNVSAIDGVAQEGIYLGINNADGSLKYSVKNTDTRTGDVFYDTLFIESPSKNVITNKSKEFGTSAKYVFNDKGIGFYDNDDGSFLYTITKNPAKSNGIVLTYDDIIETTKATIDVVY